MNTVFTSYLNKKIRYNFHNGPNVVLSEEKALHEGVNCIGLMHLLIKSLFKVKLPSNLRVLEIYNDNPYFTQVFLGDLKMGDIIFLGRRKLPEYLEHYIPVYDLDNNLLNEEEGRKVIGSKHAGYHTVMFTGEIDKDDQPLVIDIQKSTNRVKIWNLKKLMENRKYEVLYKIKRLK